jgi:hypothetical protein
MKQCSRCGQLKEESTKTNQETCYDDMKKLEKELYSHSWIPKFENDALLQDIEKKGKFKKKLKRIEKLI